MLWLTLLLCTNAFAQGTRYMIKGQVTDAEKMSLPGPTVVIVGTTIDADGNYTLTVTRKPGPVTVAFTAVTYVFCIGASLPAYAGAQTADTILTEIDKNRQIELAYQGFRLEDSRRFSRPGPGAPGAKSKLFSVSTDRAQHQYATN